MKAYLAGLVVVFIGVKWHWGPWMYDLFGVLGCLAFEIAILTLPRDILRTIRS